MSYILEAIKKLEQKRQQEESPSILTLSGGVVQVDKKRLLWPYVTAGAILLNGVTALALFWYIPGQHTPAAPKAVPVSTPIRAPEAQPPAAPNEPSARTDMASPEAAAPEKRPDPKAVASPAREPARPSSVKPVKAVSVTPPKSTQPAPPKGSAVAMYNLPEDLRKNLPDLKMTVHSYDDHASSRFAIINNQNLKEGQFIIPDLKLERITPDGAVLSYQGHRFVLGIN